MVLRGYVGIGESGRGNRGHESFFINGRYMRSALLSQAVESACRERVMIGKFPTCVLHLTMPYELVDVNVHPNKLEVRFQNENALMAAVETIVREGITDRDALERPAQMVLTPEASAKMPVQVVRSQESATVAQAVPPRSGTMVRPQTAGEQAENAGRMAAESRAPIPDVRTAEPPRELSRLPQSQMTHEAGASVLRAPIRPLGEKPAAPAPRTTAQQSAPEQVQSEQVASFLPEAPKPMRLIGTVFDTYILVEYEDHLLMLDQHAVHERLLFDRMMNLYDTQRVGQELMLPLVVSVTRREQQLLEENRALLEKLGLVVTAFGEHEVSVRSIPMLLGEPQTVDFLHDVLDQLGSERGTVTLEKRRAAILQTACKHAVKGGEKLNEDAIRDLVSRMIDQKVTPTCPHGRPLVVALSHAELDKRFRRIQ